MKPYDDVGNRVQPYFLHGVQRGGVVFCGHVEVADFFYGCVGAYDVY